MLGPYAAALGQHENTATATGYGSLFQHIPNTAAILQEDSPHEIGEAIAAWRRLLG